MRRHTPLLALVLLLLTGAPVVGNSGADGADGLKTDVTEYARVFGVSVEEAERRLTLQALAGRLDAELVAAESRSYSGLWIEHEPGWRIVVSFTDEPDATLLRYVANGPLAGIAVASHAERSLAALEAAAIAIRSKADIVPFDLRIDVQQNVLEVMVVASEDWASFRETESVPLGLDIRVAIVASLIRPAADIYGGLSLGGNGCTSGFSISNSSGVKGITTAGHCGNVASYQGVNLPYQYGFYAGSNDSQWHTAPGFTVRNRVWDGIQDVTPNYRNITSRTHRDSQAIGSWVCKYGRITYYGCGTLVEKTVAPGYIPQAQPVFHRLANGSTDLTSPGDSGGPVFYAGSAWGIIVAEGCYPVCNDSIYSAINYVEYHLAVTVLTQ
ncbi:MAG: hypothetical protein WEE67_04295 [Chloroflexota bacterium]